MRKKDEIRVDVDFNVNDRLSAVGAFLQRLGRILDGASGRDATINFEKCRYLGPDAVAIVAALAYDLDKKGRLVRAIWPAGPRALRSYIRHSGLEQLVSTPSQEEYDDPSRFTVLPIRQFDKASFGDAEPIINMVGRYVDLDAETSERLRTCVYEVLQNVYDHAKSSIGAVAAARYMERSGEVRVAIVDRGIGIYETLRGQVPGLTAENAISKVLAGNVSSMSRPNNMGLGIRNLKDIVLGLSGTLVILSGDRAVEVTETTTRQSVRFSHPFSGTGVFFTARLRQEGDRS